MLTLTNSNHPLMFEAKESDPRPVGKYGIWKLQNGDKILLMDTGDVLYYDGDVTPPADPWKILGEE